MHITNELDKLAPYRRQRKTIHSNTMCNTALPAVIFTSVCLIINTNIIFEHHTHYWGIKFVGNCINKLLKQQMNLFSAKK
jgi:hypothetical protein